MGSSDGAFGMLPLTEFGFLLLLDADGGGTEESTANCGSFVPAVVRLDEGFAARLSTRRTIAILWVK